MPQSKAKDYIGLTVDELSEKYEAFKKELFELRVQTKLQKLHDVKRISKTKRQIAKILTIQKQKGSVSDGGRN